MSDERAPRGAAEMTSTGVSRDLLPLDVARSQVLTEIASEVVVEVASDGTVLWVSASARDVFGWLPSELVGRGFPTLAAADPEDPAWPMVVADDGWDVELEVSCADGSRRRVTGRSGAIRDAQGLVVSRLIALRDAQQQARGHSERQFRSALESAPIGMAIVDLGRRFVEVNPALCDMLERDEVWLLARRLPDVVEPEDDPVDRRMRDEVLSGRRTAVSGELRLVRADGARLWAKQSVGLLRRGEELPPSYVSTFFDATGDRSSRERLRYESTHDTLTELANRRGFAACAGRLMSHRPRSGDRVACLFIDVDRLKEVNDRYGHAAGDRLLVEIAARITDQVRADDVVARLDGDEFAVVLAELHAVGDAEMIAAKIQQAVQEPIEFDGGVIRASVSIGVALVEPGEDPETAVHHADFALYRAKRAGRARSATYLPAQP